MSAVGTVAQRVYKASSHAPFSALPDVDVALDGHTASTRFAAGALCRPQKGARAALDRGGSSPATLCVRGISGTEGLPRTTMEPVSSTTGDGAQAAAVSAQVQ